MRRFYDRTNEWLLHLPQKQYAVVLGVFCGVCWLIPGLLLSGELHLIQALVLGLVMFGLESVLGLHQTTDEN